MTASADRHLLFGLLALQNGLINQGQLVLAFQAWTLDKSRSLADHLEARGDLTGARRALLEGLAEVHLDMHGGDMEKSLAAVPAGKSTREGLANLGDPAIEATLGHVGSGSTERDHERTATYAVGTATSDGQRFRVLRPHAQGGLGEVFVALDSELHREVALKQILDQHADDAISRQRFVLEAEITGGLEHPGIVPVYGLGTYGGGRPYYAMRFIRGQSLKEAIATFHNDKALVHDPGRRSLALRKLFRRFTDVCDAIEYAHSRGVLHRDIKPGNVIVGKHGETLVVDWGLAKAVGRMDSSAAADERTLTPNSASGSAETFPGSAIGTPAYMSPEQAVGDLDRLGPASDVYSLGATLYCLLAGKPPFEGDDLGAVLRAVQKGDFTPPRELDPSIDRALEAVCLKAMALKPGDRYASPRALADEIERWMADEPVTARREPTIEQARRWVRRNRTAVIAVGAALVVAVAGLGAVAAVQRVANAETSQQRELAEENFALALRAVEDLTGGGLNPLLKEQGLHELRQELLEKALKYYRDVLSRRGDDPKLKVETAAAHERVGDILSELGRLVGALESYDQALFLIEPLVRAWPGNPTTATAQVRLHAGRLQALRDGGRYPEAIVASDRARTLGEALLAARDGTEDLPKILAGVYVSAGIVLRDTDDRADGALRFVLRAHELAERATDNDHTDLTAVRTLLNVSIIECELLRDSRRVDEIRRLCEQSIAFGKARVAEHPRDVEIRMCLAYLEGNLGDLEKNDGQPREALELFRSSVDRLESLARENHVLIQVRYNWAQSLNEISQLQTDLRQYSDAEHSALKSINLCEELVREVPSSPYFQFQAARGYGTLGKALLKAGSQGEALAILRKSVAILETSHNLNDRYNLACTLALASTVADPTEGQAAADRQRRDADRAVATIRRAIERGWANSTVLKTDPDFDALRSRPDFQLLMMDLAFPAEPFLR